MAAAQKARQAKKHYVRRAVARRWSRHCTASGNGGATGAGCEALIQAGWQILAARVAALKKELCSSAILRVKIIQRLAQLVLNGRVRAGVSKRANNNW